MFVFCLYSWFSDMVPFTFLLGNRLAGGEIDYCFTYSVLLVDLSSVYIAM